VSAINVPVDPKFFELCVTTEYQAVDFHELDISNIDTDGRLFEEIWHKYKESTGSGIEKLLLCPKYVDFVKVNNARLPCQGAHKLNILSSQSTGSTCKILAFTKNRRRTLLPRRFKGEITNAFNRACLLIFSCIICIEQGLESVAFMQGMFGFIDYPINSVRV
jgi:hypothetical protein